MGSRANIPSAGSLGNRKGFDESVYSKINRVQVTDVNVEKGTVSITFLNLSVSTTATIPLLGLSCPPDAVNRRDRDYTSAGWGRYIPQVGDVMIGAYGTDGTFHLFGYSTSYYTSYTVVDSAKESKGGIGWSSASGKTLKPGDWDFKSSRGCMFYLGDKINLSSSNCAITLDQTAQETVISSPLLVGAASSSQTRYGSVKRRALATDTSESYITIAADVSNPSRVSTVAQEYTVEINWGSGEATRPPGGRVAYFAIGDVVDDLSPTAGVTGYDLLQGDNGPVRYIFYLPNAADPTDNLKTYLETVDALGNYSLESSIATSFKWSTPLASWEVSNLSTEITSTGTFDVTSTGLSLTSNSTMDLSATAGFTASSETTSVLDSSIKTVVSSDALVHLGKDGVIEGLVKGNQWKILFDLLMSALLAHTHPSAVGPTGPSADFAIQYGLNFLPAKTQLVLSTKVFTE